MTGEAAAIAPLAAAARTLHERGVMLGPTVVVLCALHPNWQANFPEAREPAEDVLDRAAELQEAVVDPATCREWMGQAARAGLDHLFASSSN